MKGSTLRVTINAAQPSDDDIFKPGTLVVSKSESGSVVLITSASLKEFAGVVISSNNSPTGGYSMCFCKETFVKFVGNIVLEQE